MRYNAIPATRSPARGWPWRARTCIYASRGGEVERWGERAEAEARAALALDPDLAEAHLARAAVARKREFDWNATITAGRRALVLNPNLDQARFFVAAAYYHNGYMEEALIEMEKGRSLHGVDVIEPIRIEALVALFSGSFAPARARLEEVSRLSSQAIGDTYLALAYYYSGSVERGRTMLESLASHSSASTAARAGAALAGVLAAQGEPPPRASADRSRAEARIIAIITSPTASGPRMRSLETSRNLSEMASHRRRYRIPLPAMVRTRSLLEPLRRLPDFSRSARLRSRASRVLALGRELVIPAAAFSSDRPWRLDSQGSTPRTGTRQQSPPGWKDMRRDR